jgi:hypothetical protein
VKHLLLVSGYLTMMLLVIVLLPWFQRDGMEWHWTALPGYFATGVLLFYTPTRFSAASARRSRSTSGPMERTGAS